MRSAKQSDRKLALATTVEVERAKRLVRDNSGSNPELGRKLTSHKTGSVHDLHTHFERETFRAAPSDLVVAHLPEQGLDPASGRGGAFSMEGGGHRPQVGVGVIEIQALNGLTEAVRDGLPDPNRAVGHDQHPVGGSQAALLGFEVEASPQHLNTQARGDVAALGDQGALFAFDAALFQLEAGGGVYPVPAVDLFSALALGGGLSPIGSLADVPSVDLDHQGDGLLGPIGSRSRRRRHSGVGAVAEPGRARPAGPGVGLPGPGCCDSRALRSSCAPWAAIGWCGRTKTFPGAAR